MSQYPLQTLRTRLENHVKGVPLDLEDLEGFIHEVAHLSTLYSVLKAKKLLTAALEGAGDIHVSTFIKERLKTVAAQDRNEMQTTAVTLLAMEQLGGTGGTFAEAVNNMFSNLQTQTLNFETILYEPASIKKARIQALKDPLLLRMVHMMLDPRNQGIARSMVTMLKDLENSLQ